MLKYISDTHLPFPPVFWLHPDKSETFPSCITSDFSFPFCNFLKNDMFIVTVNHEVVSKVNKRSGKNVFLLRTLPHGIIVNGYLRFVLKSTLVENLAGKNRTCNDSITNEKQNKANLLLQNLLKMESRTFTAAVRGYHFYRRY